MGIVRYPEVARRTKCKCYLIKGKKAVPENMMCFSKGIIGTLSDAQDRIYCPSVEVHSPSKELKERHQKFTKAIHRASKRYEKEHPDSITRWLDLVEEELKRSGIEIR